MLVKWPGVVKPGTSTGQYTIIEDLFPTVLEMAGVGTYNTIQEIDGKSLTSVLKNPHIKDTTRALIWHFPNKWIPEDGPGINYHSAIRQGNWKLVYNLKTGTMELYNLATDVGEHNDLASENPLKTKALATLLSNQLRKWNAIMPSYKASGKIVPLPEQN